MARGLACRRRSSIRPAPGDTAALRSPVAARRGAASSRPSSIGSCCGWRATASGRSSSGCCSSTCSIRRSAGSSRRGIRRTLAIVVVYVVAFVALRRVPEPDLDAAHQRDRCGSSSDLPSQLADATQEQLETSVRRLQPTRTSRARSAMDRLPARRSASRRWRRAARHSTRRPAAGPDRRRRHHRRAVRLLLLPVWVFYLLKDRVSLTDQFDRASRRHLALRHAGRSCGSSSGSSASGCAAQLILGLTVGIFTFIGLIDPQRDDRPGLRAATRSCSR